MDKFIQEWVKKLSDKNWNVRRDAVLVLAHAAEEGQDITPAIPAFGNALSDKNKFVRGHAANALTDVAKGGQDITPTIPALINALSDEGEDVRCRTAEALTHCYVNKKEWNKVEELLRHGDYVVRVGAADALKYVSRNCDSIEKLDEIQKAIENSFAEWKRKQPQGPYRERVRRMLETSKLLMDISKKKAELAKRDGELLLGETVKKPKDSNKKMYRNLRGVSRNG
jgi:HEAT repeat protein